MMWNKPVDDPLFCEVSRGIATLTPSLISIVRPRPPFPPHPRSATSAPHPLLKASLDRILRIVTGTDRLAAHLLPYVDHPRPHLCIRLALTAVPGAIS
jgi:hypothetical protein